MIPIDTLPDFPVLCLWILGAGGLWWIFSAGLIPEGAACAGVVVVVFLLLLGAGLFAVRCGEVMIKTVT